MDTRLNTYEQEAENEKRKLRWELRTILVFERSRLAIL